MGTHVSARTPLHCRAAGGRPEARWAWVAIVVMAVPLLALVVVVLA